MTATTALPRRLSVLLLAAAVWTTSACKPPEEALTRAEAEAAMDQAASASRVTALTADAIEISTDFTLGEGVEAAAEALAAFYRSQAPCADVTRERGTLTIDYGAAGDDCVWRGRTWSGQHVITIGRAEAAGVQVDHTWQTFSDGHVTLDGTATVTWSAAEASRQVTHALTWTGPGGQTLTGEGDRTQTLIDPAAGVQGGVRIDGSRSWTAEQTWSLSIVGVEARPEDPVPQAGRYILLTPKDKRVILSFERLDADRIEVSMQGPKRRYSFVVRRNGQRD